MKCLRLIGNQESCQFSYKNHFLYPFVIESLYLYLLCLSAALLCYTGFQNSLLIRSTSCSCSTCCFGLSFQLQNLQDFTHFLSVYFFSKVFDGSTSSPGCSVIIESPGLFKFWADPVEPWITIKSPKAAISSRGKQNNLAVNFFCLA